MNESLKIYVLGVVAANSNPTHLTILGEHRGARATHRVEISRQTIDHLSARVNDLKTFVEDGNPPLKRSDLEKLGQELAGLLLQDRVKGLFDGAVAAAKIMPFELYFEDSTLGQWPWEFLFDSVTRSYVCENFQPICRGVFSGVRDPVLNKPGDLLRVLLALGTRSTGGNTTPESEVKWLKEVFNARLASDAIDLKVVQIGEPQQLLNEIVANQFDVFHFYGHGDFDPTRDEAYLQLEQRSGQTARLYADHLATMLMGRGIRFAFLNACKTAVGSPTHGLIRSGMAQALVDKGLLAVVATQFVMPDTSAHYLSSMVYNSLALGKQMIEAIRDGRMAMKNATGSGFLDWGIPVLYTRDAALTLRPTPVETSVPWRENFEAIVANVAPAPAVVFSEAPPGAPSVVVGRTLGSPPKPAQKRIALVDFDAKVAFLPDLVEQVNAAQKYYHFQVAYLPMPSGAIRTDMDDEPQLYLPRIEKDLKNAPAELHVDMVCCLTQHYLAGTDGNDTYWNHLAAAVNGTKDRVIVVTTGGLAEFAREAGVSFAKAVLCLCLSQIVVAEQRWPGLGYHRDTEGCLFDFCENHADVVVGLKKMAFTHKKCRDKIKDPEQLAAIDALIKTDITEPESDSEE